MGSRDIFPGRDLVRMIIVLFLTLPSRTSSDNQNNTQCDGCVRNGGQCGSDSASGSFVCSYHQSAYIVANGSKSPDTAYIVANGSTSPNIAPTGSKSPNIAPIGSKSPNLAPNGPKSPNIEPNKTNSPNIASNGSKFRPFRIGFILILAFGSSIVLIVALCCLIRFLRRYSRSSASSMDRPGKDNVEEFMRINGSLAPKRYSYSKVKKITNSFKEKLGQGGFGAVFKGKLPDGRQVAVKVLNEAKANGDDFFNEVASIGKTSHVNVVTLLGFYFGRKRRALIYEYMAKGSLDKAIQEKLEWTLLYQIAIGVARGLEYLHRGCNTRIVHFDIKPHNILLDENFRPKISDFGLAKLCQSRQSKISMLGTRGTIGYIAPEVVSRAFGCVSHKSDVFSYGMLLIEMTGLEKNKMEVVQTSEVYFPDWIYEHLEQGKDIGFHDASNEEDENIAKKMVIVGLWCIQTNPLDRPAMSKVVEMLERDLESLPNPPKPLPVAPPRACLTLGNSSD